MASTSICGLILIISYLASVNVLGIAGIADEGAFIGVNIGADRPSPASVVQLLQEQGIKNVRLRADTDMLHALANTGIRVTLTISNRELFLALFTEGSARIWVQKNVLHHLPKTKITAIGVGSDILTVRPDLLPYSERYIVTYLEILHKALSYYDLDKKIQVSIPISSSLILDPFPPSQAFFNRSWDPVFVPLLEFLQKTRSHLMLNVYPYYNYIQSRNAISLDYALFRTLPPNKQAVDSNTHLHYTNVFDSIVDAAYFAMANLNITDVPIVVTESGWPSKGDESEPEATIDNANTYNSNLIRHVLNNTGTPMHPRAAVSTYLYELYNQEMRSGSVSDKNWGLFEKNGVPIYMMRITGSGSLFAINTVNKTFCVAKEDADPKMLMAALDWTCGEGKVDCSVLLEGKQCFYPNTVSSHASFAFSSYCNKNGINKETCNFNNVAYITTTDPSYGNCLYPGSLNKGVTNGRDKKDHSIGTSLNPSLLLGAILAWGSLVMVLFS